MKRKIVLLCLISLFAYFSSSCASFSAADRLYGKARQFAKEEQSYFAFMALSELIRDYPDYRFAREAKFAIAEYYFLEGNFNTALNRLVDFLHNYADNEFSIFAKSFLYKIITDVKWIEEEKAAQIAEEIKAEFFSKPAFFVFSEFKETSITSFLRNTYVLKEYVDKIDIFQNDKLFISVSP